MRSTPSSLRRVAVLALAAALVAACGSSSGSNTTKAKVGLFLISSSNLFNQIQQGFEQEFLQASHLSASQVDFVSENAQGDDTQIETIARQYANNGYTMVEVIGTPAVVALAKLDKKTPIIAVAMGDPVGSGVAKSLDAPGGNVTGSIDYIDPSRLLDQMVQVKPAFTTIGTIYNPSNENMQVWIKALRTAIAAHPGLKLVEEPISSTADVAAASQSLQGRADAVLIGPDADVESGLPAVAKAAEASHQQLYVVGGDVTTPGVLASLGPDYPQLGSEAGDVAAKVYLGTPAGQVPFAQPGSLQWSVNPQTLATLGVTLPPGVTPAS